MSKIAADKIVYIKNEHTATFDIKGVRVTEADGSVVVKDFSFSPRVENTNLDGSKAIVNDGYTQLTGAELNAILEQSKSFKVYYHGIAGKQAQKLFLYDEIPADALSPAQLINKLQVALDTANAKIEELKAKIKKLEGSEKKGKAKEAGVAEVGPEGEAL